MTDEKLKKENTNLKKEISILLSCANCSENKGGYICEKEYNDKCLSQKIEYIKELKEEITELKTQIEKMKCCGNCKHCFSRNDEENVIACAYDDEFAYLSLRNCNKWEIRK